MSYLGGSSRRCSGRFAVGAAILAVVACNVYDPTILVGGGDPTGSGAVGAAGGKGGKAGVSGGAGVGGTPSGGIGGRGAAGSSVGGMGMAGASSPGGAGGTAGTENLGGQGAEGGEAGMGDGGEDMGGSGGDSGTGGAGRGGAGGTSGRGGTSGMAGVGGTSGTGGSGGKAGSSGAGGTTGGAGSGGKAGGGGSGGSATVANGCAELSVPLDETDDRAHFVISLESPLDFSDAVITMRVYAAAASGGAIRSYVQDDGTFRFLGNSMRPAFKAGWQDVTWDVGAQDLGGSSINKTNIKRIGIEVNAEPSTEWASGATVLFVDSVTVTTPNESFMFGTTSTVVTATNLESDQSGEVLWMNSYSSDTTASGVGLRWVATCP